MQLPPIHRATMQAILYVLVAIYFAIRGVQIIDDVFVIVAMLYLWGVMAMSYVKERHWIS